MADANDVNVDAPHVANAAAIAAPLPDDLAVAALACKLPSFWQEDPEL
jgi:hypothetical protein